MSVESYVVLESQKYHSYHHNNGPNFLVLGTALFVLVRKWNYSICHQKIGKNIANFLESVSDMSDAEDERKPPVKRCYDEQVDNIHGDINTENTKSRQMYHNNKISMKKKEVEDIK